MLNGIAYNFDTDEMYVTGKMWNTFYSLRVEDTIRDKKKYLKK